MATATALQDVRRSAAEQALWPPGAAGPRRRGHRPRDGSRAEPETLEHCLALLDDAIARAGRWYADRVGELVELDRCATDIVRRLRLAGAVGPSMTWSASAAS